MIQNRKMKSLCSLIRLLFVKIKKNLLPVILISIITGFIIPSQAKDNSDDSYYVNFKSKIDKVMGQDPNLSASRSA